MKPPEMPPPSDAEIAEWADGIVYATAPDGAELYFDVQARAWRRVRRLGPEANAHWPADNG